MNNPIESIIQAMAERSIGPIEEDWTMPDMKRSDMRKFWEINQDRRRKNMHDFENGKTDEWKYPRDNLAREKMYPLPDRFYDEDYRAAPDTSHINNIITELMERLSSKTRNKRRGLTGEAVLPEMAV